MSLVVGGLREKYDRAYGDRELVRRIVRRFGPERGRMALVAALIVCRSALTVARPLLIARCIDVAVTRPAQSARTMAGRSLEPIPRDDTVCRVLIVEPPVTVWGGASFGTGLAVIEDRAAG